MMPSPLRCSLFTATLAALMITISGFSGCSSTEQTAESAESGTNLTDHSGTEVESSDHESELEELYWARINESRENFTQADVDFMAGMIVHHAQALIMSRLAPDNDASQTVQVLASRIINAQKDEIRTMQKWLRDRGQPVPEIDIDGLQLMVHLEDETGHHSHIGDDAEEERDMQHDDHHVDRDGQDDHDFSGHREMSHNHHDMMHDHHDMPGMLTQQQLEELAEARGTEFDRKFLDFMIEHHWGAVIMVQELFSVDGAGEDREAFDLASGIKAEQITEIERMEEMLQSIPLP